ncbi:MAG TPA: glucosaminidase domain-containing protein [Ferruginibacter sp.]|nr:glucosaminidase domain-containing protein [Ferruginibacter sp.]
MAKLKTYFVAALVMMSFAGNSQKVTAKFISHYLPIAQKLSGDYGIPIAIILGVSTLESGSGTSPNARQLNNFFGVTGKNSLKKRRSVYKQYAQPEDSFRDFCEIMSRKKFYPSLKNNWKYAKWLEAMNHASYAGAKSVWLDRVTQIVKKHKLEQYDKH